MMAKRSEFIEHMVEQLAPLGLVSARAMFGGWGVYCDGLMFGLFADDVLYFKVDDHNRAAFEAEDLGPFMYESKGKKPVAMSYYQAPESAYDSQDVAVEWGRLGVEAALRQQEAKPKKKAAKKVAKTPKAAKSTTKAADAPKKAAKKVAKEDAPSSAKKPVGRSKKKA